MSAKPWYAWYPADYKSKTAHLSFLEDAAYRRLLDAYYERSKPLPVDRPSLYRICGAMTVDEQGALDCVVDQYFTIENNELINNRCKHEIDKQANIRARLSEAGRRGGELAGKGRPKSTIGEPLISTQAKGLAQANPQPQPQSQVTSTTTTTKIKNKTRKSGLPESLERLEASPRIQAWCEKAGENQIKAHLIYFVGYAKANGKQYADWDQAVINAIRCDWAGIRKAGL